MQKKLVTALLILAGLLGLSRVTPGLAQSANPPTPEPTVVALQQTVEALSAKVAVVSDQQAINKQWYELEVAKVALPVTLGALIFGAIGISSPFLLNKWLLARMQKRLNLAIYRADPTYLPIHVPANGFDCELERLKWMGFKNLKPYVSLTGAQTEGVIIYPISGIGDLNVLDTFIQEHKSKEKQMAFVVYAQTRVDGAERLVAKFFNATLANSSVAMVTHIYALARGLKSH